MYYVAMSCSPDFQIQTYNVIQQYIDILIIPFLNSMHKISELQIL